MNRKIILSAIFLCAILMVGNAHAATLYVNTNTPQPGDGLAWATAFKDLNQALKKAGKGDQIWVAAGMYTPTDGADRSATFKLKEGVEVYGGFAGNESELAKRDFKKHQSILSGDIGTPGMPEDNVHHVVTGANGATLDGFTITGGYSQNTGWQGSTITAESMSSAPQAGMGAGMLNFEAAPKVVNCVFQDNHAVMGGAVYSMNATSATEIGTSPEFIRCTFWQNSALLSGGGVANFRTSPMFASCEFDSNIADETGGGMLNDFGASPRLLNTIFRGNEATFGGGVANRGTSTPAFYYTTFTDNRSTKSGPAIHQGTGANTSLLIKSVVWDNECECDDTRFHNEDASVIRVEESTIQNGYEGKLVFRANPGLDRKSQTMLNVGFKTNAHRFRSSKIASRAKDINRYSISKNLPAFDPTYVVTLAPEALSSVQAMNVPAPQPVQTQVAMPEPTPTVVPEVIEAPAEVPAKPEPMTAAAPALRTAPAPVAQPEPVAPAATAAATAAPPAPSAPAAPAASAAPEAGAVAMVTPPPSPIKEKPAKRPDGPPTAETMLQNLDFDGNGCITINEASGPLQQNFWRVDGNGDGCLSKVELQRLEKRRAKRPSPAKQTARASKPAAQPRTPMAQPKKAAPKPTTTTASLAAPPVRTTINTPKPAAPTQPARVAAPVAATPVGPSTGYTLFAPIGGKETYLVDMDGKAVKTWRGNDRSSGAVYLLNNGNLLRTVSPAPGEVRTPFVGEGVNGGIIQEVSPRGQVVWEYSYVDNKVRQHHDIEPLPNGNVLILAWELKDAGDLAAAGASVRNHPDKKVWSEHIVEVRKSGPRSGYIVWEWHAWDHLVQNTDRSAPNYTNPSRLPQRIDVNYNPKRIPDWQHANSIDFNPIANQIVISLRNMNEIWVIDHSTTTEQAASNTGGIMRRGGDLLFRWGNPKAYGSDAPQTLFGQHDARWITGKNPGDETIMVFNNGTRRTKQSDVLEIKPAYYLRSTQLDAKVVWSYSEQGGEKFYADHISGAQRLANGNTLICEGTTGRLFEVTPDAKIVWNYQHTGSGKGPGNHVFRATRLPQNHPGVRRLLK